MAWREMWAIAAATPSEIVVLLLVLATISTYFIYTTYDTGLYATATAFFVMIAAGLSGHIYFSFNGIFFAHDVGRSAVVGATLAMSACFVVSVLAIRVMSDVVYSRYSENKKAEQAPAFRRSV